MPVTADVAAPNCEREACSRPELAPKDASRAGRRVGATAGRQRRPCGKHASWLGGKRRVSLASCRRFARSPARCCVGSTTASIPRCGWSRPGRIRNPAISGMTAPSAPRRSAGSVPKTPHRPCYRDAASPSKVWAEVYRGVQLSWVFALLVSITTEVRATCNHCAADGTNGSQPAPKTTVAATTGTRTGRPPRAATTSDIETTPSPAML